jgi:hypothetical protein
MNNRNEKIDAIASGDVERLKRLRKRDHVVFISPHNGKIFKWVARETGFGQEEVEISFDELEELKKDHEVISFIEVEGRCEADVSHSEEEVIQKMKAAGEWI